jgi:hypothetical protein
MFIGVESVCQIRQLEEEKWSFLPISEANPFRPKNTIIQRLHDIWQKGIWQNDFEQNGTD